MYLGEHFFSNSCQLQSLQPPAAFKNGYFIALLARNFQVFSRSCVIRTKISFCGGRARKMVDIFYFFIAFTCAHVCLKFKTIITMCSCTFFLNLGACNRKSPMVAHFTYFALKKSQRAQTRKNHFLWQVRAKNGRYFYFFIAFI